MAFPAKQLLEKNNEQMKIVLHINALLYHIIGPPLPQFYLTPQPKYILDHNHLAFPN